MIARVCDRFHGRSNQRVGHFPDSTTSPSRATVTASPVAATSSLVFTLRALHAWNHSSYARPHRFSRNRSALTCGNHSTGRCIPSLSLETMTTSAGRMLGSRRPTHPAMRPVLVASVSNIISTGMDRTSLLSMALQLSPWMVSAHPSTLAQIKIYSNIYSGLNSTSTIARTNEVFHHSSLHGVSGLRTILLIGCHTQRANFHSTRRYLG